MTRTVLHIVGGHSRARAEQAHIAFALGHHAEIYADPGELLARPPVEGIVLAADPGTPAGVGQLIDRLGDADIWLPVICVAERIELERVVAAIRAGALDYLALPFEIGRLARRLHAIDAEGPTYRSRRRGEIEARRRVARLSARERQVLALLSEGLTNKEIALKLKISPRTVEIHRANMMGKLAAQHSAEAVRAWVSAGLDLPAAAEGHEDQRQ